MDIKGAQNLQLKTEDNVLNHLSGYGLIIITFGYSRIEMTNAYCLIITYIIYS